MYTVITDILEYVVAPLFPYVNSLAISRLLSTDIKGPHYNNAGLELMNILSAGKLLYAVGHFTNPVLSQLFMMAFIVELSLLFWLTAQIKEWGLTFERSVKMPVYMATGYFVVLVLLLLYAAYGGA